MSEQLSAAAQAMGVPEPLVERSAQAWADATGQSYDDVLAAWAGGEAPPAAAPAEPAPTEEPAEEPAEAQPEAPPEEAPAPAQPAAAAPEPELEAAAAAAAPPPPERVSPEEALEYPVVVTVPTAGITERTGFSIPTWLGALLLIVPAFGLIYLALGSGAAECGSGTALRPDRVTGVIENCDGSPFEGRGAVGGGGADLIALGEGLYQEQGCAGCHGPQGGGGVGPALTGVMNTFSSCDDQIEWVQLGSQGFAEAGRSTYGDTGQTVDPPGMPGFADNLTDEQLASVVAFERVRHAGGATEEVLADCGLVEEEGGEGEEGAEEGEGGAEDGQDGAEGNPETTDTTAPAEATAGSRSG